MTLHDTTTKHDTGEWWDAYRSDGAIGCVRSARWLEDRIKRGRKECFAEYVELTPHLAGLLLDSNPMNRSLSEDTARKYARDISAGRWQFNGETIIVSEDGLLNDGQTRCAAVLISGRSIHTLISFGSSRESRTTVDGGRARTLGDYLHMDGQADPNNVAAMAVMILDINANGRISTGIDSKPTKQEALQFARESSDLYASFMSIHNKKRASKIAHLSLLGVAHYFINRSASNAAVVDEFFSRLVDGDGLRTRDPRFIAREKLLARELRLNKNERLKTIFSAWNNWRDGREVRTIVHSFKRGDKLPEIRK